MSVLKKLFRTTYLIQREDPLQSAAETGPAVELQDDPPVWALPEEEAVVSHLAGQTSIAALVEETQNYLCSAPVHSDQRIRLRGRNRLDICASSSRIVECLQAFAQILEYLRSHNVSIETRTIDGWRTCAVIDGIAIPIRIRERMHRVQNLDPLSAAIERLLGGHVPQKLVPSGRLELQIMRFGTAVSQFPVNGEYSESALSRIERGIHAAAQREKAHQRRMMATAMQRDEARPEAPKKLPAAALAARGTAPVTIAVFYRWLDQLNSNIGESRCAAVKSAAMSNSVSHLCHALQSLEQPVYLSHGQTESEVLAHAVESWRRIA